MQRQNHFKAPTKISRRVFARSALSSAAVGLLADPVLGAQKQTPIVDTHMHVWADNPQLYPFDHPYIDNFQKAPHPATLEMLIDDMDRNRCTHAVLVQVIYHGWDNSYVADCVARHPDRFRAHGLIDPTDPKVAERMEFWIRERGLHGMRFSAIYYQNGTHGGDGWIDAEETHQVWRTAERLGAVFNFFIAAKQLPRLERMVRAHPEVPVIIDHLSQVDLGASDPEPDFRLLLSMAKYPSVRVKVSELTSVSKSGDYPFADAYPYVKRVYEAFGPDRLLFGTGYPGTARADYKRPSLANEIELIRHRIPFFSQQDRDKILGLNAVRLWGFEL